MILYGVNPVREALRGPRAVEAVWATDKVARAPWLGGSRVAVADAAEIAERCGSPEHQGVCARVAPYAYADAAGLLAADEPLIVALDEVTDPQNLGAIARTAEVAGATGLVIPERRSAEVTPVVCKASAGAVEHLAVARVRNLADYLSDAKGTGAWVYGAATGGIPYDQPDYRGRAVIVFGSEGKGLRPRVRSACDELIAVPLRGRLDSLNVSSAASAVLYGILQFRRLSVDSAP